MERKRIVQWKEIKIKKMEICRKRDWNEYGKKTKEVEKGKNRKKEEIKIDKYKKGQQNKEKLIINIEK